jgi:hypothetical protein
MIILFILITSVSCKSNLTESTVKGFLDAVQAGDITKASDYLFQDKNSYDFINSIFTFENEEQKELALKTFSKMNYRIKSTTKIDDNKYKATVEIEYVDFVKITEEVLPGIVDKTNATIEQTEEEFYKMIALVNNALIEKLSGLTVPMIKSTVEIELFKDEAITKISIIPNEELLNSISGNLVKAYEMIGEEQVLEEDFE